MMVKGQPQNNGGRPSVGSIIIVFVLKIAGGLSSLFHIKGSCGNMTEGEKKAFSVMVDGIKQDMTKRKRRTGPEG